MTQTHVPYEDIPREARDLLDETYRLPGVIRAWNTPNPFIGGQSPAEMWPTNPRRVLGWAESLTGMIAT